MHYIVDESPSTIRALARQTLKGRWKEAFAVFFMGFAIINVPEIMIGTLSSSPIMSRLLALYQFLVTGPVNMGLATYFLRVFRQKEGGVEQLFSGFDQYMKVLLLYSLILIKVLLWSMLFVFPGIVAAMRYSQAYRILADDPSKSPIDCIEESKLLMSGNVFKFLLLSFSFIGWALLATIPSAVCEYLLNPTVRDMVINPSVEIGPDAMEYMGELTDLHPLSRLLSVLSIFVNVYTSTAQSCFYDLASGRLAVRRQEEI